MKTILTNVLRHQRSLHTSQILASNICEGIHSQQHPGIIKYHATYYTTSQSHTWNKAVDCTTAPFNHDQIYGVNRFVGGSSYVGPIDSILQVLKSNGGAAKVIIINGTSSVGKTTLVNNVLKLRTDISKISQDDAYKKLLFDYLLNSAAAKDLIEAQQASITEHDIMKVFYGYKVNKYKYQDWQLRVVDRFKVSSFTTKETQPHININNVIYQEALQFLALNKDVIVDVVLDNEAVSDLCLLFSNYIVSNCLLYSPLEENLQKCFMRNILSHDNDLCDFRHPNTIIGQYCKFYKFVSTDRVSANSQILEKVDKIVTKNILEKVQHHVQFLLSHIYDDLTTERYTEEMQKTTNILDQVRNDMMLSSNCDTFVIPSVSHDYIINCVGSGAADVDIAA